MNLHFILKTKADIQNMMSEFFFENFLTVYNNLEDTTFNNKITDKKFPGLLVYHMIEMWAESFFQNWQKWTTHDLVLQIKPILKHFLSLKQHGIQPVNDYV